MRNLITALFFGFTWAALGEFSRNIVYINTWYGYVIGIITIISYSVALGSVLAEWASLKD